MGLFTLYVEEMKTLVRGRFALFGAAAILLLLGVLAAAVAPGASSQWAFLFLAYAIIPSALVPFAALRIAGPRASRFVQAVFTAPVSRASYFCVQLFVCLSVGALYLAATLPALVVHVAHVGVPPDYARFIGVGVGMVLYACAVGLLIGTLFPGRSVVAPVSLAMVPVFLAFALPFALTVIAGPSTGTTHEILVRVVHISPHVNLLDAQVLLPGFWPQHHERSLLAMVASLGLCILLAAWAYLRHQGVETWESGPAARTALWVGVVGALLLPALMPAMTYDLATEPDPQFDQSGMIGGVLLLDRGGTIPPALFTRDQPQEPNPTLELERTNPRELVVMMPYFQQDGMPQGPPVSKMTLNAFGRDGLTLTGAENLTLTNPTSQEVFTFARGDDEQKALVYRFPVEATPTDPAALADVPYVVQVYSNVTREENRGGPNGQNERFERIEPGKATVVVHAEFPSAQAEMAMASAPLPLLLLLAGIVRQTRRG